MNEAELRTLLTQPEGPTLDFKREWFHLDAAEPGGRYQRDALIRDVLALANGSTSVAGLDAHLVIGASDSVNPDGTRDLFDAIDFPFAGLAARVTQLVNSACSPAIGNLDFSVIPVDGCRIGVLTVHATPLIHETTRKLEPGGKPVTKHVVFLRSADTTEVACAAEREALLTLKRRRFNELRKVSPAVFGTALGALLGASAGVSGVVAGSPVNRLAGLLSGSLVFGIVGLVAGVVTQRSLWIKHDWPHLPRVLQFVITAVLIAAALWLVLSFYGQIVNGSAAG